MTHFQEEALLRSSFFTLLAIIVVLIAGCKTVDAQNTIQNFTGNDNIEVMVEKGLQELKINNTTITILPLKDYYKTAQRESGGKPWGVTIGANKRVFTIIISTRHEAEVGLSFEERIAHELIHVKQVYDGKGGNEKEAYEKQHKFAESISL